MQRNHSKNLSFCTDREAAGFRERMIPFGDIISIAQEENYPKVVSFDVRGYNFADFNVKFNTNAQAGVFVRARVMSTTSFRVCIIIQTKRSSEFLQTGGFF